MHAYIHKSKTPQNRQNINKPLYPRDLVGFTMLFLRWLLHVYIYICIHIWAYVYSYICICICCKFRRLGLGTAPHRSTGLFLFSGAYIWKLYLLPYSQGLSQTSPNLTLKGHQQPVALTKTWDFDYPLLNGYLSVVLVILDSRKLKHTSFMGIHNQLDHLGSHLKIFFQFAVLGLTELWDTPKLLRCFLNTLQTAWLAIFCSPGMTLGLGLLLSDPRQWIKRPMRLYWACEGCGVDRADGMILLHVYI